MFGLKRRVNLEKRLEIEPKRFDTVLLIDMQESFLKNINPQERGVIIAAQMNVLGHCASHDIPLIALEYRLNGSTILTLKQQIRRIPRHKYIIKNDDDGFYGSSCEELLKTLEEYQSNTLYLMGINASVCVKETGIGAVRNGFKIVTSNDVIADKETWGRIDPGWFKRNGVYVRDYNELTAF